MQQWEYCEVFYFINRVGSTATLRLQFNGEPQNDVSNAILFLNQLGRQGWELVSHVVNQEAIAQDDYGKFQYTSTINTLIFKRPLARPTAR
jgi:hypothetical protein